MGKRKKISRLALESITLRVYDLTDGDLSYLVGYLVAETQNRADAHGFRISAVNVLAEALLAAEEIR